MASRRWAAILACLFLVALGVLGPRFSKAQETEAPVPGGQPPKTGAQPGGTGDATNGGGEAPPGYDYFTANLRPDMASYLRLLSARHAGERTWAAYWTGRYAEALADCEYALERFPNHPRALHLMGEIAKTTNQVSMAVPYFEQALKIFPQYAFTHAQYGEYLIEIGAAPAGVGQLREALRIDPNQFQAKAWLAEAIAQHPDLGKETPGRAPGTSASSPNSNPVPPGSNTPKRGR